MILIENYHPSYLIYLKRAKISRYIKWSTSAFAENLKAYLHEQGIKVTEEGYNCLLRTCERFAKRIFEN